MPFLNYREETRQQYGTHAVSLNTEQINAGALLRIADACELMASNYKQLQAENETLKRQVEYFRESRNERDRSIAALKGVITKLKKKM